MTDQTPEPEFDVKVIDGRDMAFFLLIRSDGTSDMRARCSKEQAVTWLEDLVAAIKDGTIGPGKGEVEL